MHLAWRAGRGCEGMPSPRLPPTSRWGRVDEDPTERGSGGGAGDRRGGELAGRIWPPARAGSCAASRDVQANSTSTPLREPERLAAVKCAYQLAASPGSANRAECHALLSGYLDNQVVDYRPALASGWVCVGRKYDVPKDACY